MPTNRRIIDISHACHRAGVPSLYQPTCGGDGSASGCVSLLPSYDISFSDEFKYLITCSTSTLLSIMVVTPMRTLK